MHNVVGELRGTDPEAGYWVVCAHYDATGSLSRLSHMARIGEGRVALGLAAGTRRRGPTTTARGW